MIDKRWAIGQIVSTVLIIVLSLGLMVLGLLALILLAGAMS